MEYTARQEVQHKLGIQYYYVPASSRGFFLILHFGVTDFGSLVDLEWKRGSKHFWNAHLIGGSRYFIYIKCKDSFNASVLVSL